MNKIRYLLLLSFFILTALPAHALVSGNHLITEIADFDCVNTANYFSSYDLAGNFVTGTDCTGSNLYEWGDNLTLGYTTGDYKNLEFLPEEAGCDTGGDSYDTCLPFSINNSLMSLTSENQNHLLGLNAPNLLASASLASIEVFSDLVPIIALISGLGLAVFFATFVIKKSTNRKR